MNRILIISHTADPDIVTLEDALVPYEADIRVVHPHAGDPLPDSGEFSAIFCLGGPQSAADDDDFLRLEREFLVRTLEAEIPILAICLGSQLLAAATGGTVIPNAGTPEVGFVEVSDTGVQVGNIDWKGLRFSFHSDTFTVPAGAEILATTSQFIQAYRVGSAVAVQYHPESSVTGIHRLMQEEPDKVRAAGIEPAEVIHQANVRVADSRSHLDDLLAHLLTPCRPLTEGVVA